MISPASLVGSPGIFHFYKPAAAGPLRAPMAGGLRWQQIEGLMEMSSIPRRMRWHGFLTLMFDEDYRPPWACFLLQETYA